MRAPAVATGLIITRRAKAIEQGLTKRAEDGSSSVELAAVLQEYGVSFQSASDH